MKKILSVFLWLFAAMLVYLVVSCAVVPLFRPENSPKPHIDLNSTGSGSERVLCVDDNEKALLWRIRLIESAQENLIFTTYHFQDDESGQDVMAALMSAAKRGVKIRMAIDGFTYFTSLRGNENFGALGNHPNVEVKIYNPVNFLKPWKLNYRMHDKYLIADHTAYMLGGRNTQNLSLGDYQDQKDVDRDVLVYSASPSLLDSIYQVEGYFQSVWDLKDCKPMKTHGKTYEDGASYLSEHYETLPERCPGAYGEIDWLECTYPAASVRLLHNPPEAANKAPVLWDSIMDIMGSSKKIMIQTPYMICNREMYENLHSIALSAESAKILTNSVETGANLCGCVDYLNQKKNILDIGMELYEYAGEHSSHAKTVLVDDRYSIVGSFNFDMRSAYLDTETMLLIDSPELTSHLQRLMDGHMDESRNPQIDGTVLYGEAYEERDPGTVKMVLYHSLRPLVAIFRHLL